MNVKTYLYFWAAALICVLWGYFSHIFTEDTTLYINIYDTYFVVAQLHLCILLAIFYSVIGLAYFLCRNRRLITALTGIHSIITIIGFFAYFILLGIVKQMHDPHSLFDSTQETQNTGIVIILFLIALVQPLFLANIAVGLVRKIRDK